MRIVTRRGLTLVELMIALAVTGVIGAAMVGMVSAVSAGTDEATDMRGVTVERKRVSARVGAAVREASMVLDASATELVLWTRDLDDDGLPGVHEIERIEFNSAEGRLDRYAADPALASESYELSEDFLLLTDGWIGAEQMLQEGWSTNVSALTWSLDDADPQAARLVSYRLTFTRGRLSDEMIGAAGLRNEVSP